MAEEQVPHDHNCSCEQCRDMSNAISAQNPDGSYVNALFYVEEWPDRFKPIDSSNPTHKEFQGRFAYWLETGE